MTETILLAQRHMDEGLDRANLMIIVPFPGTLLYDRAMEGGHLSPSFDVDMMNWMYPTMTGTIVHPEVLRYVTRLCWKMLNPPSRIAAVAAANVLTKDSDGNNLAASQACQAAKERLRRREVGKSISITVLRIVR